MPTQTINGTAFNYTEKGQGPALVLLHGFPLDHRIWEAQVEGLSGQYRVIAPDLRGFGQSNSTEPFTLASQAEDLCGLLRKLGALPCVLAGLSMGGYIALEFVHKYPMDLRGLALVDTKAEGDTAEGKEARNKMAETARTKGSKAVSEQMMPKMLAPITHRDKPQVVQQLRSIMESCPAKTIEHACLAMRDRTDHTANLPSIPVPTLIIVGDSDAIIPVATAQAMRKSIPHAQLVVIPAAGHLTTMEQPQAVNDALRRFVDSAGRQ